MIVFVQGLLVVCLLFGGGLLAYAAFWTVRNDWKRRQASRRLERRGGFIYDRDRDRLPL